MSAQQNTQTQEVPMIASTTSEQLPQAPEAPQSVFTSLMPMVLIFVVFYFLLIRPQEKKRKAQEQFVATVKPGEEVLLHSGIYGKVVKINENDASFILQISKDTEIKVMQSAIADIVSRKTTPKADDSKSNVENKNSKKGKK